MGLKFFVSIASAAAIANSAGLQEMGPVGPGGFGHNVFGLIKTLQIGNNSQQFRPSHSRLDKPFS